MPPSPPPAPLETSDPDRARVLKAKIRDRISDVRRHLIALRTAMADFGEDFDLAVFQRSYESDDPIELNRVKAVERGVDQLYNYIAELAAFGLELAAVRSRRQETNARVDIDSLERIGVIGPSGRGACNGCGSSAGSWCTSTRPRRQSRCTRRRGSPPPSLWRSMTPTAIGSPAASARHDPARASAAAAKIRA